MIQRRPSQPHESAFGGNHGHRKILLIEDNADIRETFKFLIEHHGYQVETAANGLDALELIPAMGEPSIIFLDMNMSGMDGLEFLRTKQRLGIAPETPVIVFSATPKLADLEGVTEWVKKPVDLEFLLAIVERYCEPRLLH